MKILFRTDASPIIGIGHLTRCKALAKYLKKENFDLYMLGPNKNYFNKEDQNTFTFWQEKEFVNENDDFYYLIDFAKRHNIEIIILDDYRIQNTYQRKLSKTNFKLVQFESRYQLDIYSDIIINSTIGANINNYKNLIKKNTKLLLGPKYSSIRDEFLLLKKTNRDIDNSKSKKIYINFGGGDDRGAIKIILSLLMDLKDIKITIVSGKNNPRNKENLNFINNSLNIFKISYLISPDYVSKIINSCDIAILAGGTSTFEASFCGLPMIIIPVADNQVLYAKEWVDKGAALHPSNYKNLDKENLIKAISKIFESNVYKNMANASSKIVDGLGTKRITRYIKDLNLLDK